MDPLVRWAADESRVEIWSDVRADALAAVLDRLDCVLHVYGEPHTLGRCLTLRVDPRYDPDVVLGQIKEVVIQCHHQAGGTS